MLKKFKSNRKRNSYKIELNSRYVAKVPMSTAVSCSKFEICTKSINLFKTRGRTKVFGLTILVDFSTV